jgi:short-subunit dehydrogenase
MPSAKTSSKFTDRYGRWALIAGASEGLGAAYARALAARGMNCVLVARRTELLDSLAETLHTSCGIETRCIGADLGLPDSTEIIHKKIDDLEIGLVVYNAAYAPAGNFDTLDADSRLRVVDVNVRGPVALAGLFLPQMIARKRGALILMSSLAGNQGSPRIALYAASKAFNTVLAEGLWHELKDKGVDVLVCCAGAVRTPGFAATAGKDAPGTLDPDIVVQQTLAALGRGPRVIPGFINKFSHQLLTRLMPRRAAIAIMAASTKNLSPQIKETVTS